MTTPPTVLLVLAWDDDDPAVHRVAPTDALPARPTLPLVRALAAEQPVLALLPQLPPGGPAAPRPAPGSADFGSRLVGVADSTPGTLADAAPAAAPALPTAEARPLAVQLRQPLAQRVPTGWQTPTAPYAGRAESPAVAPTPAPPFSLPAPAVAPPPEPEESNFPAVVGANPGAPGPATAPVSLFEEPEEEIGTGEATALAEDNDPVRAAPAAAPAPAGAATASLTQGLAALQRPPAGPGAAPAPAFGLTDDLHYRVIQYARFATYLSDHDTEDVGAIYAPDWPTWLAALEIAYRRRRPLVLHLGLLAAESAAPAERGWLVELERYALRRAHTVLVTTAALRAQVLRHYGLPPGRVRVVPADDADGIRAALASVGAAGGAEKTRAAAALAGPEAAR
ncbi:glycosyltransferase [Hymenobacter caeli]|uniref:Glycosyltransferase subfamily 4-like N-terminal domain-containing protein n=1 Tax=Hymenobacter caeli TaxID=2735894 RepID=A0ABX2FU58_9BACT|nr:glycosyltransferase [Hymenobacter caeli]NRT20004.1 hypothetical protein [Hymenobacter caeli]